MTQQPVEANVVLTADTSQYDQSISGSADNTAHLGSQVDSLTGKLNNLTKSAGQRLIGFSVKEIAGVGAATAAYAAYERQMVSLNAQAAVLNRTVDGQKRAFSSYADSVATLRDTFGTTTRDAAALVETLSRVSDNTAPLANLATTYTKLSLVTGESSAALAASMTQLQRTMSTPQRDTAAFANQLAVLSKNSNASAQSILDFSQNIAPVSRLIGLGQQDVMSLSTAFIKAGQDGYRAASTYNKIVSDIAYQTQSGSPGLSKYANLVGLTLGQFKQLSGQEQISQIFESINRQGPRAISTLNQMGLDGMNTVRTITAMSQQSGGISEALYQGRTADPNSLNRGADAAMSGIVAQLGQIRSEFAMTAEQIGRSFAPVAKVFLGSVQTMAQATRQLTEGPIGKLIGVFSGGATAIAAFAGSLALAASGLLKFAAINMAFRNSLTSGFRDVTHGMTPGERAAALQNIDPSTGRLVGGARPGQEAFGPRGERISANGNFISRAGYNIGSGIGLRTPEFIAPGPGGTGPNLGSRLAGYGMTGTAWGMRNFITPMFSPAAINAPGLEYGGGLTDESKRFRFFKSATLSGAFSNLRNNFTEGQRIARGMIYDVNPSVQQEAYRAQRDAQVMVAARGGTETLGKALDEHGSTPGNIPKGVEAMDAMLTKRQSAEEALTKAASNATRGLTETGAGAMAASKGAGSLAREAGRLSYMMSAATAGLASTTGTVGKSLMSGLGLTGPLIGLMGGMALFQGFKSWQGNSENNYTSRDLSGTGVNPYITASGGTPIAAGSSPFTLGSPARATSLSSAYNITSSEYNYARNRQYQPKNTLLNGMDRNAAVAYLRSQFNAIKGNKNAVNQLAVDVAHYFPLADANWIMDQLQTGNGNGLSGISTFMGKAAPGTVATTAFMGMFDRTDSAKDVGTQYDRAYATIADNAAYIGQTYGPRSQNDAYIRGMAGLVTGSVSAGNVNFYENNPQTSALANVLGQRFGFGSGFSTEQLQGVGSGDPQPSMFSRFKPWNERSGNRGFRAFLEQVPFGQYSDGKWNLSKHDRANVLEGLGISSSLLNKPRDVIVDKIMDRLQEPYGKTTDKNSLAYRLSEMASGQVTQTTSFTKAINQLASNPNAQYKAINQSVAMMQAQGLDAAQINIRLNNMMAQIGNPDDAGYKLLAASSQLNQRNLSFQLPYMSQTQQFGAQSDQFVSEFQSHLGPEGRARRDNAVQAYQTQVMQQYDYFKQQLYQQREYEVMRTRAQEDYHLQVMYEQQDFNLQRQYQEQDYNISRERAQLHFSIQMQRSQTEFNISRQRGEEDFQHSQMLMFEQSAKTMMNVYQRVQVQSTSSAGWLLFNQADETNRIKTQEQELQKARALGLSNAAIRQFGLTDPNNAQQLTRMLSDIEQNPNLIKRLNAATQKQLKAAKGLVTDQANRDWTEFVRSYRLSRDRALADFRRSTDNALQDFHLQLTEANADYQRSLNRQQQQYDIMMSHQADAYKLSMDRSAEDLARSAKTIDGNFEDILTMATKRLSGHAKTQAEVVLAEFHKLEHSTKPVAIELMQALSAIFGVPYHVPKNLPGGSGGGGNHERGTGAGGGMGHPGMAGGGVIPGFTPGRDVHHFYSPTGGNIALSGGESIMRPEWTRAIGGEKEVSRQNEMARRGLFTHFAGGGVYRPVATGGLTQGIHDVGTGFPAIDFGVPTGTPVHAVASGRVTTSRDLINGSGYYSYGRYIQMDHGAFSSLYAHLSQRIAALNDLVTGGHIIGLSGATGNATGPHLHFGTRGISPLNFVGASTAYGKAGSSIGAFLGPFGGAGAQGVNSVLKKEYAHLEDYIASMQGIRPLQRGQMSHIINKMARKAFSGLMVTSGATPGAPTNVTGNRKIVKDMAAARGWSGGEWDALYQILMHESGFRNTAQNPNSSAYGMFQFLDSTWGAYDNIKKTSNPRLQTTAGLDYIKGRYGDPIKAWNYWKANGSYGQGAIFSGRKSIDVGESGPEMVLPLNDKGANFIQNILERSSVGNESKSTITAHYGQPVAHNLYNNYKIDKSTNFTGPITVQAQDPNDFMAKLQARQRTKALTQPQMAGSN